MIPIELTVEGLYSYQKRQSIDFRKLTSAGLFGIFGAVGSGKSSVLEAITYAIYGKTDRLNISGDNRYYNMMNLKSNELYIDFIFETGSEQTAFRAIVSGKRNSKRFEEVKTLEHKAYKKVENKWIPIELGDLERAVGLNFVNFKRTIIIPQGQFQEFLQLGSRDRTTMMKELFNLQKYEFYYKVVSLEDKNNNKKNNLQGQLQQLGTLEKEQVDAYKQELLYLEINIKNLEIKFAELQKQDEKLRSIKELILKKEEAEKTLNDLTLKEPIYKELRVKIERYEHCIISFKHLLDSLKEYRDKENSRRNQILTDNDDLNSHNNIINDLIKKLEGLKPLYDKREDLKRKADELEIVLKIKGLIKNVSDVKTRVEKGNNYWNETFLIVDNLKKEREQLESKLSELRKSIPDITLLNKIRSWYNEKNIIERQISAVEIDYDRYKKRESELISQRYMITQDFVIESRILPEMSFDECNNYLEKATASIKKRESELNEHENHILVKARLESYAENLKDNAPCPLCGSLNHPELFKSDDIKEQLKKIKEEKNDIENELQTISSISKQLSIIQVSYQETVSRLDELNKSKVNLDINLSEHNKLFIWDRYKTLKELDDTDKEVENTNNSIKSCESELSEKVKEQNKQEKTLDLARERLAELKNSLTIYETELNTLEQQLKITKFEDYKELAENSIQNDISQLLSNYGYVEKNYVNSNDQLQEEKKKRDILKGRIDTNVSELEKELAAIERLENNIASQLTESDFNSIDDVKEILSEFIDIQLEKKRVEEFNNTLLKYRSVFEQLKKDVGERTYDADSHEKLISEINLYRIQLKEYNSEHVKTTALLRILQKNLEAQEILQKELETLDLRSENLKIMKSLFKASGFVNYISSAYLRNLCNAANDRYFQLTRQKLSLEITDDNNFQIRDYMNGGKERSVKTLSGGQIFQASLSLALALADNIQKITKSNQNFFFLDEGFGSLDKESLNVVFETLKSLRKEYRIVGVISHVEEMQQEIEVHLRIENDSEHGSIIHKSWEE